MALAKDQRQLPPENDDALARSIAERGWAVARDWLDPVLVKALAAEARRREREGRLRRAGIGRGTNHRLAPAVRGDRIDWIDPTHASAAETAWLARMERLRSDLNRRLFLGLFGLESHFALYPPGAAYDVHVDSFVGSDNRVLSSVLYLNTRWREVDDGRLRLYLEPAALALTPEERATSAFVDVLPRAGTLVLFLSDRFPHEVLAPLRRRRSLAGWFTRSGFRRADDNLPTAGS